MSDSGMWGLGYELLHIEPRLLLFFRTTTVLRVFVPPGVREKITTPLLVLGVWDQ